MSDQPDPTSEAFFEDLVAAIEARADEGIQPLLAELRLCGLQPRSLDETWIEMGRSAAAYSALEVLFERGMLDLPPGVQAIAGITITPPGGSPR